MQSFMNKTIVEYLLPVIVRLVACVGCKASTSRRDWSLVTRSSASAGYVFYASRFSPRYADYTIFRRPEYDLGDTPGLIFHALSTHESYEATVRKSLRNCPR